MWRASPWFPHHVCLTCSPSWCPRRRFYTSSGRSYISTLSSSAPHQARRVRRRWTDRCPGQLFTWGVFGLRRNTVKCIFAPCESSTFFRSTVRTIETLTKRLDLRHCSFRSSVGSSNCKMQPPVFPSQRQKTESRILSIISHHFKIVNEETFELPTVKVLSLVLIITVMNYIPLVSLGRLLYCWTSQRGLCHNLKVKALSLDQR